MDKPDSREKHNLLRQVFENMPTFMEGTFMDRV